MDGLSDGLDGTFDAADQLSRYYLARARGTDRRDEPDSRAAFEARRERVRETFLDRIGGLPARPDSLGAEITGRDERDGYAVESLVFESRPGFHVTANCYAPTGDGPHPGILFLCGHADPAKADPENQRACATLARNGFVVLVLDPLGQGERKQYRDLDIEGETVSGGGGTFPHIRAGRKCAYAGANLARYMVHDARCALDYLVARPDVDEGRIGAAGTSGGGTRSMYLALVDDRIDALAPCCSVSTWHERLKTGGREHAESALFGSVPGVGYDDLVTAAAPRPVCVGAAASDRYFPVEGAHETFERAERVYGLYDATDRARLVTADAEHCSVYEFGPEVFEFFCERLGTGAYEPHDAEPVNPDALHCTPDGNVLDSFDAERSIDDLIREYASARDSSNAAAENLRETIADTFSLDRDGCALHPRRLERRAEGGITVEHVWFRTERDPDAVVAGVLVSAPDTEAGTPAVVCYADGTRELPAKSDNVAELAREHGTVLAFDPRGVGAVRNRTVPVPEWADTYCGTYGTEYKLATDAFLLGDSLVGARAYDTRRAVEFLRSVTGAERVALHAEGEASYYALYAAVVAPAVSSVSLREPGPSFLAMATEDDAPIPPALAAFDAVGTYDFPQVRAALERRGVTVDGLDA